MTPRSSRRFRLRRNTVHKVSAFEAPTFRPCTSLWQARTGARKDNEEGEIFRSAVPYAMRLAEPGTPVVDVCRQIGVTEATYYTWKKKFGELGVSELKCLKILAD